MFPQRDILVLDEAHTIERQLMNFLEVAIDDRLISTYAPSIIRVPQMEFTLASYRRWIADELIPAVNARLEALTELAQGNEEQGRQVTDQASYLHQLEYSQGVLDDSWVFWSSQEKGEFVRHQAKPVNVAPFVEPLLLSLGKVRVHMSAYPTTKDVYCRTLGLDPERTAWAGLASTFPVENRKVIFCKTGSMGRKSFDSTFPNFVRVLLKILASHAEDSGVIHCTSYELGKKIVAAISGKIKHLILFSEKAEDRVKLFEQHSNFEGPSVIVSPSMVEGFDFTGDLARFAVIAKASFPYLGDRQVQAKMEQDPEWYDVQVVSAIIQASGRIVRSDTDWGTTYILDSDAHRVYEKRTDMFPKWFRNAVTVL
jgi:Rad3-related DNA helicase